MKDKQLDKSIGLIPFGGVWFAMFGDLKTDLAEGLNVVIRTGFEPVTYCLEGSCSIQLSYRTLYGFATAKVLNLKLKNQGFSILEVGVIRGKDRIDGFN